MHGLMRSWASRKVTERVALRGMGGECGRACVRVCIEERSEHGIG